MLLIFSQLPMINREIQRRMKDLQFTHLGIILIIINRHIQQKTGFKQFLKLFYPFAVYLVGQIKNKSAIGNTKQSLRASYNQVQVYRNVSYKFHILPSYLIPLYPSITKKQIFYSKFVISN